MSKCWYCNEELLLGNNTMHIGICDKCYDEMFKMGDEFIGKMISKISDLETKLAESEIRSKESEIFYKREINRRDTKLRNIKQQLAEKEKEIAYMTKQAKKFNNEAQRYFEDAYCNDAIYQDKISFALEQLAKVKELCKKKFNWWENSEWEGDIYDKSDVSNAYFDIEANIDHQIKAIKEME